MKPNSFLSMTHPPAVMGVLNVTPDSFSDGGRHATLELALRHALSMQDEGADIIDVGGESSRPGAAPVSVAEELDRVCPVIERLRSASDIAISVDTSTPAVMLEAVRLGASMINDIRALSREGALEAVSRCGVPVCLMHMQGAPATMQQNPAYTDVVAEVEQFLIARTDAAVAAGISRSRIAWDPGFGFGKTIQHNLQLLQALPKFVASGHPLLVGVSRKSMLGHLTGRPVDQRLAAGLAVATIAAQAGAAVIRTHDVRETIDAVKVAAAFVRGQL
ncbi:dihydropteroate synthase [Allohahella sp. A8]|uniref:dihydropteroate synthase n=1 Tax=Allohahella sp. A8 TaxID=3141461 RepID=UPI003A7FA747